MTTFLKSRGMRIVSRNQDGAEVFLATPSGREMKRSPGLPIACVCTANDGNQMPVSISIGNDAHSASSIPSHNVI